MQSTLDSEARSRKIARAIETKKDFAELREHLKQIIESAAFRGSHRGAQFLRYICEQTLEGHSETLKERTIGVELFGRLPSYDTGEDAIVRVTASDVRKRLSNYYLITPEASLDLHIHLPVGSYVPEFTRDIAEIVEPISAETQQAIPNELERNLDPPLKRRKTGMIWIAVTGLAVLLVLGFWWFSQKKSNQFALQQDSMWSAFFVEKLAPLLITSDPNIAEIQGLTGERVSVSDYANQVYISKPSSLSPEIIRICHDVLRGDKAASVDTPIVAGIAELAAIHGTRINVRAARDIHFTDLDTDDNLIFLGSPRTNPWTSLYDDQLNFRFIYDDASRQEIIQNMHPRSGEVEKYIPTAKGFATGQSFAVISFIRNPNRAGHVLILAGANAEGTKAAGELAMNRTNLAAALLHCGIAPSPESSGTIPQFQLLLKLRMMAGSPTAFGVAACRNLSSTNR